MTNHGFDRSAMANGSTFRIVDLLVITGAIAAHVGMRARTITHADESFVLCSPLIVALIFAIYATAKRWTYAWIFGIAWISAFATSTAWAIEKVFHLPGTSYMHNDWGYNNYGDDWFLNSIAVVVTSCFASAVCGQIGAMIRFVYRRLDA